MSTIKKILCLYLIIFSFAFIICLKEWTPAELAALSTNSKILYSPDLTIDEQSLKDINSLVNPIVDEYKFNLKCFIVDYISSNYKTTWSTKKDIERFTNDLAFIINKDREYDKDSIIIVISMSDRLVRIRTGENVRDKVMDTSLQQMIGEVIPEFKKTEFIYGIKLLLEKLVFAIKYENTLVWVVITVVLSLIGFFIALAIWKVYTRKYIDPDGLAMLNKLKEKLKSNKPKKLFLDTTCVICLDDFSELELKPTANSVKDLELVGNEKETKLNINGGIIDLQCGHRFHDECIKNWMKKDNNTCPTCRTNIDESESDVNFKKNLIEVQSVNYPSLREINFDYYAPFLSWSLPYNNNIDVSSGNYNGSMWDAIGGMGSSGGATGSW